MRYRHGVSPEVRRINRNMREADKTLGREIGDFILSIWGIAAFILGVFILTVFLGQHLL